MKSSTWIHIALLSSLSVLPILSQGMQAKNIDTSKTLAINSYGFCDDPVNDPSSCRSS